jgi:hypothetical protein
MCRAMSGALVEGGENNIQLCVYLGDAFELNVEG